MINPFIKSLPLIAQSLGEKYGIKVFIGGKKAYTDGNDIYLPSLPMDSKMLMINLTRGFIDHESAHIRETDFNVKMGNLSPLGKHFSNSIEDFRVEKILSEEYPGCKDNFEWLTLHFFDVDIKKEFNEKSDQTDIIPNFVLLTLRSFSVPKLEEQVIKLKEKMDIIFPDLSDILIPILNKIKINCNTTKDSKEFAIEIIRSLSDYMKKNEKLNSLPKIGQNISDEYDIKNDVDKNIDICVNTGILSNVPTLIERLLAKHKKNLPPTFGDRIKSNINEIADSSSTKLNVATPIKINYKKLTDNQILKIKKITTYMSNNLQCLLQSSTLKHSLSGYYGGLDTNLLHKISVNSPKIFRRTGTRVALNTAVHILIDTSISMEKFIELTSLTTFSICQSLSQIPGINVGATTFPSEDIYRKSINRSIKISATVSPLLSHSQPMHKNFSLEAKGYTPLGEALWWVIQNISILKESRKIIIIITDGEPDSPKNFKLAISEALKNGIEIYGLAIDTDELINFLPGRSIKINNIEELPKKLFWLLSKTLPKLN
jgi:hypothetical protein